MNEDPIITPRPDLDGRPLSGDRTGGKIGVMGAGLIGCYVGGLLAEAGRNVVMVGRGRIQGEIAQGGLRLTRFDGEPLAPEGFLYATDVSALAGCDTVIVTVKSQDTEDAARAMLPHLDEGTLIVSFQNSLGNRRRLTSVMPFRPILMGVVPFNVTSPEPGRFHKGTEGALLLERSTDPRVLEMREDFARVGQELELREDMLDVMWGKLLLNLNNPLNALHGGTLRSGLRQGAYRRVLARLIAEALAALDAAGIAPRATGRVPPRWLPRLLRLPSVLYVPLMDLLLRIDPEARSSMLDDLELGRGSENDMLQGEIIRLGRRHGVRVETNRRVAEATADAFAAGTSPRMSGRDMVRAFLKG